MTLVQQPANGVLLFREVGLPALAVALIVVYSDIRIPLGLPGHRALVWLTLLVVVALATRRREMVIAVGAAATMATFALQSAGPWASGRYVAAAVLLYTVAAVPVVRRRRWLLALAAAPIHLVALGSSVVALMGRGHVSAFASAGMTERVLFHLAFGWIAGLLGLVLVSGMDCLLRTGPAAGVPAQPEEGSSCRGAASCS